MAVEGRGSQGHGDHLMLQGLNCHFKAGMLILSSKQSLAILSRVDHFRKHAKLSAKNSSLLTKSWKKFLHWKCS